jgi:hypothetical protein
MQNGVLESCSLFRRDDKSEYAPEQFVLEGSARGELLQ